MQDLKHIETLSPEQDRPLLNGEQLSTASPLQKDILKVLAYFDIFDHPLTVNEIYSFLPSNSTSAEIIARECISSPLREIVFRHDGYFSLSADVGSRTNSRTEKERRARKYQKIAMWMAALIRRFPFVRGVFLSGELSKGVASKEGDIDYVIVTRPKRLWICRTLLILFKKTVLFNSKKYFCLNLFVSEDRFGVETRNLYSAVEVATLRPLHNIALFNQYLLTNDWFRDYFPNWNIALADEHTVSDGRSLLQRTFELPFDNRWGDRLDHWLMQQWRQLWKRRYPVLDDEERERLFLCRSFISTAYGEDFLNKVMDSYKKRLKEFGID